MSVRILGQPNILGGPVLGASRGATSYADAVRALGAILLMDGSLNGAKIANLGSAGAALDGTPTNVTVGATGMVFNGTTSLITVPTNAAINALSEWTYIVDCTPTDAGEISLGNFWNWGNGAFFLGRINSAITALRSYFGTTSFANSVTTTGLTAGQRVQLFFTFSFTGDKKIRVYKAVGGTVTEYAYSAQTALGDAGIPNMAAVDLIIGNNGVASSTFNGPIKLFAIVGRVLTSAEIASVAEFNA